MKKYLINLILILSFFVCLPAHSTFAFNGKKINEASDFAPVNKMDATSDTYIVKPQKDKHKNIENIINKSSGKHEFQYLSHLGLYIVKPHGNKDLLKLLNDYILP